MADQPPAPPAPVPLDPAATGGMTAAKAAPLVRKKVDRKVVRR